MVAFNLFNTEDFTLNIVDIGVELVPCNLGCLYVLQLVFTHMRLLKLLELLNAALHGFLVAENKFVDFVHITDTFEH